LKKYYVILLLFFLAGCAVRPTSDKTKPPAASAPKPGSPSGKMRTETGVASYYHDKFTGRATANGEKYQPQQLTAAHRTLPFGTQVKVTNLSNGKTVTVRINDRGPHTKGRILDLSKKAAQNLDMMRSGTAKVKLEYTVAQR
jgi:rare lipoprotein A